MVTRKQSLRRWWVQSALLCIVMWSARVYAYIPATIVSENPKARCEDMELSQDLTVYKDPSLFLSNLAHIMADPVTGWRALMRENPVFTTLRGHVTLMFLAEPREFRNFSAISAIYELADPRLGAGRKPNGKPVWILPVRICGPDNLGFVVKADLEQAQKEILEPGYLPPSVKEIPPALRAGK